MHKHVGDLPAKVWDTPAIQACIAGTNRVRKGVLGSSLAPSETGAPHREGWYMQRYSRGRQRWDDLYFFTEQEWREVDYQIPNFWCSNRHPLFCKVCSVSTIVKHSADVKEMKESSA